MTSQRNSRNGLLLVAVLVALSVVMVLTVAMIQAMARQRGQIRMQLHALQAAQLADAGLARAGARLAADANYAGESWRIEPAELDSTAAATVEIRVAGVPDSPGDRQVSVVAHFPDKATPSVRRSKNLRVQVFHSE